VDCQIIFADSLLIGATFVISLGLPQKRLPQSWWKLGSDLPNAFQSHAAAKNSPRLSVVNVIEF